MKIKKRNYTETFFSYVAQGEVFLYRGEYYIKTEILEDDIANCVELKTGNFYLLLDTDVVYEITCHLVID